MVAPIPGKKTPNFACRDCDHVFHASLNPAALRLRKLIGQNGPIKCPKCGSKNVGVLCVN